MRRFAHKVELLSTSGEHLRWMPGELGSAMVGAGSAEIENQNGRVKSVRLIASAATHALRIGEPTPLTAASYGTRFVRRERLEESGAVIWQHHPSDTRI